MTPALIVAGWVALAALAVGWVAWATRGATPTDPIDTEWWQLCDGERGDQSPPNHTRRTLTP